MTALGGEEHARPPMEYEGNDDEGDEGDTSRSDPNDGTDAAEYLRTVDGAIQ